MRALSIAPALLLLSACFSAPAMTAARTSAPPPLPADRARVVFFMASWEADPPPFERHPSLSHDAAMAGAIVVDDRGQVFGTVKPGTFVIADVTPGDHGFFSEDVRQLDATCVTDCLAFGAMRAKLAAGRTYGVMLEHPNRFVVGGDLGERHRLDLVCAQGAPLGQPGWTWLRLDDEANAWARDHADRVQGIVEAGTETRLGLSALRPRGWGGSPSGTSANRRSSRELGIACGTKPVTCDACGQWSATCGGACTFGYTGAAQTWTVPTGVTQVTIEAWGAAGGDSNVSAGEGGQTAAIVDVMAGETLTIYVGGQGVAAGASGGAGGFNGGGTGSVKSSPLAFDTFSSRARTDAAMFVGLLVFTRATRGRGASHSRRAKPQLPS